jgi:Zinc carboxypeptidase
LIQSLPFEKQVVAQSFEGKDIYQIKLGTGKTKILLWSQMHGDESTATMALFDIFKFFQAKNDGFDEFRKQILAQCTLYFIPMLNPDGAERFQRRTATEIDMNRDALRLQTPEGVLLKRLQNTLMPDFAFNLHDQGSRTSAGNNPKQATISFLATAYNMERDWNKVRKRSMQVICSMNAVLQQFIAGHIAKYSDEHEPRAFGDNIQKWGSSLILIESGGYKGDLEKQFIRKLNFVAILSAFQAVSERTYTKYKLKNYESLPTNDGYLFDILIRNVQFIENGKTILKDIGINLNERNMDNATKFLIDSRVDDMGDLSTFWGIKELDAKGMTLHLPKDFPTEFMKYNLASKPSQNETLKRGDEATFILEKNGKIEQVVINGVFVAK